MNLTNERQPASMAAWERISATDQVEIVTRAAKWAAYLAAAYGVTIVPDELIGSTWIGTVERLDADRLSKANERRATEGRTALTIRQVVYRAAHGAAELDRYDRQKHNALPLEAWTAIDDGDMEDRIIDRLTVENFIAQRDGRDQAIAQLTVSGFTERETGKAVGISNVAVHKRLSKMRRDIQAAIA